jgi:hypothetical protein
MNIRHVIATALTTLAVAAPSAALSTAVAAGDHAPEAQTKQLLKDIAGKDKRLARLAEGNAVDRLADDTQAELVANITEARADLAEIRTAAEAADSTLDTRAARKELHAFRVENFGQVVSILRRAEGLSEAAATDAEAQAHLAAAEDAALAITATSSKADVRAAREHLGEARTELEAATTPAA